MLSNEKTQKLSKSSKTTFATSLIPSLRIIR